MRCGVERTIQHRGKAWQTAHVCKRVRGHRGRHRCVKVGFGNRVCTYAWARKRRAK